MREILARNLPQFVPENMSFAGSKLFRGLRGSSHRFLPQPRALKPDDFFFREPDAFILAAYAFA